MRAGCGDRKNPEASFDASGFFVSEHSSSGPPADVVAEFPSLRQREAAIRNPRRILRFSGGSHKYLVVCFYIVFTLLL